MHDDTYKVSISGAGLTLEREVPAHVGEQVVVLILSGKPGQLSEAPVPGIGRTNAPGGGNPPSDEAHGAVSIREYLDERGAKRNPDKITAIGCYLNEHRSQESFNRADLETMFQEAAEAVPKNIPRDLKWATRVGWIAPRPKEKGTYYVTATGMDAVNQKFPKEILNRTSQATGRTRRATKKNTEE